MSSNIFFKSVFLLVAVSLFSCANGNKKSEDNRLPDQVREFDSEAMRWVSMLSTVVVPQLHPSASELLKYKHQCLNNMAKKVLKEIPGFKIKSDGIISDDFVQSIQLKKTFGFDYFNFSAKDAENKNFTGFIYYETINTVVQNNKREFIYACESSYDGILGDTAQVKDASGKLVFSSSCAEKMYGGQKYSKSCPPLKQRP